MPYGLLPTSGYTNTVTGNQPNWLTHASTIRQRSWIVGTATNLVPYTAIWTFMASGNCCVVNITHGSPARAEYAAVAAPAFPDDEPVMTRIPIDRAVETAADARRSLNDHVGFTVSFLTYSSRNPSRWASLGTATSGVMPSPRLTASAGSTGSNSW